MQLRRITLTNFRSYQARSFVFASGVTVITGHNTAGKTNILEAVMLLATGKSFRADTDREAIRWGNELARVEGEVADSTSGNHFAMPIREKDEMKRDREATLLGVTITAGMVQGQKAPGKKFLVNGVGRRVVDFAGILKAVLFWPEDLHLITDSPGTRRRYLDQVLVQTDREYRRNLISYERGVRQRNSLLSAIAEGRAQRSHLLFWNQLLIKTGSYLTQKREEYIGFINSFSSTGGIYRIVYDKSVISQPRLEQYKDAEVAAGVTLVGPHRDDFIVGMEGEVRGESNTTDIEPSAYPMPHMSVPLSKYGSRGEQRMAVLWIKLAELSYVRSVTGDQPILLLDDIFSELDREHQGHILKIVGNQQTVITSAEPDIVELLGIPDAEVITLSSRT